MTTSELEQVKKEIEAAARVGNLEELGYWAFRWGELLVRELVKIKKELEDTRRQRRPEVGFDTK